MFRFSPRPNRAAAIGWQPWGEEAFLRAQHEGKPILLSISAVWCHWCHVMDESTYSDQSVQEQIAEHFVAVRVDQDDRPDINRRYNQGGWPTTAFLTPHGLLLAGATYLPPDAMRDALSKVWAFFEEHQEEFDERIELAPPVARTGFLDPEVFAAFRKEVNEAFDPAFGGFGREQKFPHAGILNFLLDLVQRNAASDAERAHLFKTLDEMVAGELYDPIEGGFFRYTTTRQWRTPHFEKMLEDNAALMEILWRAHRLEPRASYRDAAEATWGYLLRTVRQPNGLFGGSQDADEAYYQGDAAARAAVRAPYVDPMIYLGANARVVTALATAFEAGAGEAYLQAARETLTRLAELFGDQGLGRHRLDGPAEPLFLEDQASLLEALLRVYRLGPTAHLLHWAEGLAQGLLERFWNAEAGAFVDACGGTPTALPLSVADYPYEENGRLARVWPGLLAVTGQEAGARVPEDVLTTYAPSLQKLGIFGAELGRAWLVQATPWPTLKLGEKLGPQAAALASLTSAGYWLTEHSSLAPDGVETYLCGADRCVGPLNSMQEVAQALAAMAQP